MTDPTRYSVGCSSVDALLGGGIETGTVTQVYGEPGAGKTNLALSMSVDVATAGGRTLFIDAEGISGTRLEQLIPERFDENPVTDRIVIRDVYDFDEQEQAIKEAEAVASDLDLIVVDSITGFYRLVRGTEAEEGETLRSVTNQVTHLLSIARKYELAVLITNQVFTDPEADRIRPLGGQTLQHWSGAVIRLDRFRGGNRRATLEKHRSLPAGESATFRITEAGLVPVESFA